MRPAPGVTPGRTVVGGPVLERHVRVAAESGTTIVTTGRGMVTPLARELARSRGVTIEVDLDARRTPVRTRRDR